MPHSPESRPERLEVGKEGKIKKYIFRNPQARDGKGESYTVVIDPEQEKIGITSNQNNESVTVKYRGDEDGTLFLGGIATQRMFQLMPARAGQEHTSHRSWEELSTAILSTISGEKPGRYNFFNEVEEIS